MGGELTFADHMYKNVTSSSTSSSSSSSSNSSSSSAHSRRRYLPGSFRVPPPSRKGILEAFSSYRNSFTTSNSKNSSNTLHHQIPIPKSLSLGHEDNALNHLRFSIVPPKARRLVLFNSNASNVHGVINLIPSSNVDTKVQRFTYLMFMGNCKYKQ
jgi:hypothetical protein